MAGLLDSDFINWLSNKDYYKDKRADAAAQEFKGLLGTLEQAGPVQPGGVLESRAPDQQFWLKAAGIAGSPELTQMASQQLGYDAAAGAAMNRQIQQQGFETNNLTMKQRWDLQLEQMKQDFAQRIGIEDLNRKWAGTNASIGAAGASAQNSQMSALVNQARLQGLLQDQQTKAGPLFGQLPAEKQVDAGLKLQMLNSAVDSASGVMDYVKNRNPSDALRGVGTGRGGAMLTDWVTAVMPIAKEMTTGPGAVDEGEREFLMNIIKDPSSVVLNDNTINQMQLINRKVEDFRDMNFKAYGLPVPTTKGAGATARALGPAPKGGLKPYTPKRNQGGGRGLLDMGAP